MGKFYVITHKKCDDGSMSAAIVKKFKPEAIVFPTTYGHEWKELEFNPEDSVLFTDFCPEPADLYDLYQRNINFQVLDHHITSQKNLEEYWETNPKEANLIKPRTIIDLSKCGATITWDYMNAYAMEARPRVLDFIEIADLWKWERDPNSKAVTQYIRLITKIGSWEDMLELLDNFNEAKAIEAGRLLVKRLERDVEDLYDKADEYKMFDLRVMVANSSHGLSVSELGHKLASESKDGVGLVYNIVGKKVKISTRGLDGTTVARELAEKFGGGGHDQAAGAWTDAKSLLKYIMKTEDV